MNITSVTHSSAHLRRAKLRWAAALALLITQFFTLPVAPTPRHAQASTTSPTVAAGEMHSCALSSSGDASCWGAGGSGQIGNGTQISWSSPSPVAGGYSFRAVAAGMYHTCAVTNDGEAYCWGANGPHGALGNGATTTHASPQRVVGGHNFVAIATGDRHTCALAVGGQAYCWGSNSSGQLGDTTWTNRRTPTLVSGGHSFVAITAGGDHTCALTSGGQAYCWGSNFYGQLGDGRYQRADREPVAVTGGHSFVSIAAGRHHTCGLTTGGTAYCWGRNSDGQIGNSSATERWVTPAQVSGGHTFVAITAGGSHTCALTNQGRAYCWGGNDAGQLGNGTRLIYVVPVPVSDNHNFVAIAAGGQHTVARRSDGCWMGWGDNYYGQVGDGTTTSRYIPALISCPAGVDPNPQPPQGFGKVAPADGAENAPTDPTLEWRAADEAVDHYRYCVSEMPDCEPNISAGTLTRVPLSDLTSGTTYYWQVRACQDEDCATFTDADNGHWSFTVYTGVGRLTNLAASPALVTSLSGHSVITLTLFTPDNRPWAREHVRLQTDRASADRLDPSEGVTDAQGRFIAVLRSTSPGVSRVTAKRVSNQDTLIAATTVRFVEREPALIANPEYVKADGTSTSLLQLRAVDALGRPVANREFEFRAGRPDVAISPVRGRTDSQGRLTARVSSTQPGKATIIAQDLANAAISVSTTVRFIGPRSVAALVSASPDAVHVGSPSTVRATVVEVETGEWLPSYPIRFVTQQPTHTVSSAGMQAATFNGTISGTAIVTAIEPLYNLPIGRVEIRVSSGCAVRPQVLTFVPSFVLGADVAYPHLPGLAMPLDSNVEVDWKGCVPGYLEFHLENGKKSEWDLRYTGAQQVVTHYAIRSFNLTEDLPIGRSKLKVVARTKDGLTSEPFLVDVLGAEMPSELVALIGLFNVSDVVIADSTSSSGDLVGSRGSLSKMISIARIWPNPGGWKFEPSRVLLRPSSTPRTDEEKQREAEDLAKKQTTKLMLRGSFNMWLACDIPPTLMFQMFAEKKEVARIGPLSLGGMVNFNTNFRFDRNFLCYSWFFNDEYFRQNVAAGSLSVDLYLRWKETLPTVAATLMPVLRRPVFLTCEWMTILEDRFGKVVDKIPPLDCAQWFGEVYAKVGVSAKSGFKWSILKDENEAYKISLLEVSGGIGPRLMLGYELANGPLYVNIEASTLVMYVMGLSRPVPAVETAPLNRVTLDAEAFLALNLFNLWHNESKWTYQYVWNLDQPAAAAKANISGIAEIALPTVGGTNLVDPAGVALPAIGLTDSLTLQPILPLPQPDYRFETGDHRVGQLQRAAAHPSGMSARVLASNNLTYTEVSVAHQPETGRTLLVWTHDAPNRPVGGSRELHYSLWNGAAWSPPTMVTSDTLPDVAPHVTWLGNDRALAVWNRTRSAIGAASDVRKLEVAYAVYDAASNSWSPVQYLTNDDGLDYGITLSRNPQGEALVAWISSEPDGVAVQTAFFDQNGAPTNQGVALLSQTELYGLSVALGNHKAVLAYNSRVLPTGWMTPTVQASAAVWDRSTASWSTPTLVPFVGWRGERHDSPVATIDRTGAIWLAYIRSGVDEANRSRSRKVFELRSLQESVQRSAAVEVDDLLVDQMQLLEGERGLVAVLRGGQFHRDLYAMVAADGWSKWSKPINLTNDAASELSFDAYIVNGNDLALEYVRKLYEVVTQTNQIQGQVITDTRKQLVGTEMVSLLRPLQYRPDLTVISDSVTVVTPEDIALIGSTARVSVTVSNQGDAEAGSVSVGLYKGDPAQGGTLLAQRQLSTSLGAGFTETLGFDWVVPETDAIALYLVVDPENGITEIDETNNAASVQVFGPDFEVGAPLVAWQDNANLELHVPIFSTGTTATLPSALTVTLGTAGGVSMVVTGTLPPITPAQVYTAVTHLNVGLLPAGTYSLTTVARSLPSGRAHERQNTIELLPNLALDEGIESTDVTMPFVYVKGVVRNTSWLTVTDVLVGVFDAAQRPETGMLVSKTIPIIAPMAAVPISFTIEGAASCGLDIWVNPYGFPGAFQEQRFGDNGGRINGSETFCTRAGFVKSARSGAAPLTVVFTNTSTPNTQAWEWDFGDGMTSSLRNPGAHVYTEPGVYTVTLRATSPFTSTLWQERAAVRVYAPAHAEFESDRHELVVGQPVQFVNRSTGDVTEYEWDFGDGNTSTLQEPIHFYDRPGRYSVTLAARGLGGTDVMTRTQYITVYAARIFIPSVLR